MHNRVHIGDSDLQTPPLGIGAWQWGDTMMWGFGRGYDRSDAEAAFTASVNAGLTLIDTAESYGRGASERLVGEFIRRTDKPVIVATKFAPLPTRIGRRMVLRALNDSLNRLGLSRVDLYQVHWPFPVIPIEMLMDILADAVELGKIRYIGVSNYSEEQMRRAHAALAGRGLPLVSNQVEYSLLHRTPEVNGVWVACQELNISLIAYSPLAKGLLTGKYKPDSPPPGLRRLMPQYSRAALERMQPVIQTLAQIGAAHGGKTPAQVALNWLARQPGVLPIPGAKNAAQAEANAGAIGWDMTIDEADLLSEITLGWRK
ncbi:MAG: aldo/keto reductase [Chloroflexi bacterium]|nr:aldo/keto reductase [Chloroflexota bacterium]MCL5274536.1 aldo/keto reductase [Chloroflexota bacterium]